MLNCVDRGIEFENQEGIWIITNKNITVSCDRMELGRETLEEEKIRQANVGHSTGIKK